MHHERNAAARAQIARQQPQAQVIEVHEVEPGIDLANQVPKKTPGAPEVAPGAEPDGEVARGPEHHAGAGHA